MSHSLTSEKIVENHFTDPLAEVDTALEKLGLLESGEYYFDITHIEPAGEILTLIRSGNQCALSLYCKPLATGIWLAGDQHHIIRNQTVTYLKGGVISVATGDAVIHGEQPPLPIGLEITTSDTGDDTFFALLDHIATLVNCVRVEDQLSVTQVQRKLNLPA